MSKKSSTRCLLCVFVALACIAPAVSFAEGPDLAARAEAWEEAFVAGDIEGVAALYTEDARLMPPNAGMAQGRQAVIEIFSQMAGLQVDLEGVETATSGDIGYRVGTYLLTTEDGTVVDRGKFIETWRLVDGRWMITNDIWNGDMPAAGAGHEHGEAHDAEHGHAGDHGHGG